MALFSWIGTLCGNCNWNGGINKETGILPNTVVVTISQLIDNMNVTKIIAFLRK